MKQVIYIDQLKEQEEKPVEFTHCLNITRGWVTTSFSPSDNSIRKIFYLGKCAADGDMFVVNNNSGCIVIFKGHLNSGKY